MRKQNTSMFTMIITPIIMAIIIHIIMADIGVDLISRLEGEGVVELGVVAGEDPVEAVAVEDPVEAVAVEDLVEAVAVEDLVEAAGAVAEEEEGEAAEAGVAEENKHLLTKHIIN